METKKGMRTCKKTTLLRINGGNGGQEDFLTLSNKAPMYKINILKLYNFEHYNCFDNQEWSTHKPSPFSSNNMYEKVFPLLN